MKKRVAFFFGAGAEQDFNMPTGDSYLKSTIMLEEKDKRAGFLDALSNFFNQEYYKNLNEKNYKYYKYIINNSTLKNHLINNYKYYGIPEKLINELKEKKRSLAEIFSEERFKEYGSFVAGILDSYFHTIVNPVKLGPHRFSKVFNYYWACYFAIVEGILQNVEDEKFAIFYKNNIIQYSKIINNIKVFIKELYKDHHYFQKDNSYYHLIAKRINGLENISCSGVITTNYFNFAEREFKSICKKFSYPNGKLCYFEFPEFLEVNDIFKINNSDITGEKIFFPFIFGQSYTKPIVHKLQIQEFWKMEEILNQSDCLVILGYNINEDDMHINSYIHEFIASKPVVVVVGAKQNDMDTKIRSRLRYAGNNLKICSVEYENKQNQHIVDEIFKKLMADGENNCKNNKMKKESQFKKIEI
ncbi:MAG: hypothetical protein IKN68_03035 [Spirochaetia bacterium]|nr:hypothetical protein [Spirochaetia bacterium]